MLIYGKNVIQVALKQKKVEKIFLQKGGKIDFNGSIEIVSRKTLDQMCGNAKHQGIVAKVSDSFEVDFVDSSEIFELAESKNEKPFIVILDGIEDPRNFGAIIRSAEMFGAHGVVVEERRSAPLSAVALKASAGAAFYIPIAKVKNLPRYIEEIKQKNVWVYGAAATLDNKYLHETDLTGAVAIVIGSEGNGLRRLVQQKCDEIINIKTNGYVGSLNASVAAGILLYEASKSRLS